MSLEPRTRALRFATGILAALATLALGAGCAPRRPGDILFITIDTLRADHLSIYGYSRSTSPNLERLFADGAVFDRAYSTSSYTSASTASLLSGRLPQEHRVRLFDQLFPANVALVSELLPESYQTAAVVSTRILSDAATGLAHRFDYFDDHIVGDERTAKPTTDAALRYLDEKRDASRPMFLWVHYKDPHAPYTPPASYQGRYHHAAPSGLPLDRIPAYARLPGASDPLDYVDRYDEEIAYTDAEVGRLIDGYAQRAPIDDAFVVVTADHGESLLERGFWFVHANHVFEEQVRVPLLMRGPGVTPGRRAELVSGVDVLPTLLGFAGARPPAGSRGVDLRAVTPPEDRVVFAESIYYLNGRQWRSAIQGDRKWMVMLRPEGERVRKKRSYDLATDPAERRPQPWRDAPAGRRLLELVRTDPDPAGLPSKAEHGTLVQDNPQLLKALGYVQ